MKLGLLVVVAVAVLLPSFSESRIVSKCELKDKLDDMLDLPDKTLATVICEVQRRSGLNTNLVTSFGKCIPATPKPTLVTAPSTNGGNSAAAVPGAAPGAATGAAPGAATGAAPGAVPGAGPGAATVANTNSTATVLTNTTTATNTSTIPTTANSTISSGNITFVSNSTSGIIRRRRDANGKRVNAEPRNLYGLFQLSDRRFCDSGYCPTTNMCHLSCTALTDDDITEDIACVVSTGYWKEIVKTASDSCRHTKDFFDECD